ncbi:hypothetical protein EYC80_007488 [Monilinia laxa]|uniref:ubiquitinyl hydrolase 1 n=1 Tax=Monilinia laxa TaxID=61186 RepID=A0A5N6JW29_MONLA|nr:hypothetical protein EYC80_007488 [Monilinia laxa]
MMLPPLLFSQRRLSLRNKTCSKSPSGVTTEPSENDTVTHEVPGEQSAMGNTARRSRHSEKKIQKPESEIIEEVMKPLTDDERKAWKGWCELESDPTTHNSCATIALLNIIMNVPDLDLGENISSFKEVTQLLKPAYRGQKLSENEYIRNLHNSFARRMDILNADLALSNEVSAWKKRRKMKKKPGRNKAKSDEEPGFHFIAFVPIEGVVWRLDGLQRQPISLGEFSDDWISVARTNIHQHISKYGDGLQFNLLSLCRSPLRTIPLKLAQNIHAINLVEVMLSQQTPDWNKFSQEDVSEPIRGPSDALGVTDKLLHETVLPASTGKILEQASTDASILLLLRQQWVAEQRELRITYMDELSSINEENEQAARRKKDHTPLVYRTLKSLADKGLLKQIMEEVQAI